MHQSIITIVNEVALQIQCYETGLQKSEVPWNKVTRIWNTGSFLFVDRLRPGAVKRSALLFEHPHKIEHP